jgi:hypothetical protein
MNFVQVKEVNLPSSLPKQRSLVIMTGKGCHFNIKLLAGDRSIQLLKRLQGRRQNCRYLSLSGTLRAEACSWHYSFESLKFLVADSHVQWQVPLFYEAGLIRKLHLFEFGT